MERVAKKRVAKKLSAMGEAEWVFRYPLFSHPVLS